MNKKVTTSKKSRKATDATERLTEFGDTVAHKRLYF